MSELIVSGLNKYFGDLHVLRDLALEILPGERVSLVGPNGCGKTTLLKILSGLLPFESGSVSLRAGRRVGLLEQLPEEGPLTTVREVLWQAFEHIEAMGAEMAELEAAMAAGRPANLARYSLLQTAFEAAGGYDLDLTYRRMVNGLQIDENMQGRPFMSLSGGEKTRVNLARIMLGGADILLLDEPTNHLDLQSIQWLEEYLRAFKGTVVMVSHDRYFLDRASTRTLELREGAVISWPGNYSYFVDRRQELMDQLEGAKKRQDKEIARLEESVARTKIWGLGNKKVMKRAFAMQKRIDRIERIQTIRKAHKMRGKFNIAGQSGEEVYTLQNLSVGYDKPLVHAFSAMVLRGERIAILGPNGSGKTTFLNTILKQIPPLGGQIFEGVGLKSGYLPQVVEFSHPHRTLVDTLLYDTGCSTQEARDRLAAYEFKGEEVFKQVAVLSGGEKTRLKLCVFMFSQVNTLFLDEPTNHLDILAREWVEDAMDDFSETMVFISHDRYFIDRFATRIWAIEDGGITDFLGTYEEYQQVQARKAAQGQPAPRGEAARAKAPVVGTKAQEKQRREHARRIRALEERILETDEAMARCSSAQYERLGELYAQKEALEEALLALYEEEPE